MRVWFAFPVFKALCPLPRQERKKKKYVCGVRSPCLRLFALCPAVTISWPLIVRGLSMRVGVLEGLRVRG